MFRIFIFFFLIILISLFVYLIFSLRINYLLTLARHGDEASGANYTIYLEHLGGFLPILKGKKTSKLKPEFVIFDPLKGKKYRRNEFLVKYFQHLKSTCWIFST